jgi:hypothetical protein
MEARFNFLYEAGELYPALLQEISRLTPGDDASLDAWADRWGMTAEWCKAQARETLANHHAHAFNGFDMTRHSWGGSCYELTPFGWIGDRDRPSPAWTHKDREAFQRLAHYTCGGQSFATIARSAGVSVQAVHESVHTLATLICLPLRPTGAGRPRKRPIS